MYRIMRYADTVINAIVNSEFDPKSSEVVEIQQ